VLFGGTLVNRIGSFVLFFLILYVKQKGYSATMAGLALSAYGVGGVLASLAGGYLADRIGRRNTIAISMFATAVIMMALSRADGFIMIAALTALLGLSAELYRPAASALLADLTEPAARVTAFAVYRIAVNLGVAVGPAMGGLLADRSFTLLFAVDAATSALFGVIALVALPAVSLHAEAELERRPSWPVIRADRGFIMFLLASLLGGAVFMQFNGALPLQIRALGFSNSTYGMMMSINGAIVLLCELPLTSVTRTRSARRVMALGLVLIGAGFAMTGMRASLGFLVASVVVWSVGEIVFVPVAAAHVANIAPVDMRGRYQGAWAVMWGVSHILAPAVGAALFDFNPGLLWPLCAVAATSAAVVVLSSPPRAAVT
jgi:MFS family permease